jgi:hypothetical protein
MCYPSQQVIRKEFDYNAYIQGRLRGEYVVIYHTVVDESVGAPTEVMTKGEECPESNALPICLTSDSYLLPFKKFGEDVEAADTVSSNFFQKPFAFKSKDLSIFTTATSANCRGAP